jgi:hypothetical protein
MQNEKSQSDNQSTRVKVSSVLLLSLLALTVLGAGVLYAHASSSVSLNNVQIFVQTSNTSIQYQYDVSVYNTTGSLVAYTQTNYAGAGFELPTGSYLITATAYNQPQLYPCSSVCASPLVSSPPTKAGGTVVCSGCLYPLRGPSVEYGYVFVQVNGPMSVNLPTQNASQVSTTNVSVKVTFANGTAAAGAYVSAFVVGQSYYWYNTNYTFYGQTDSNGMATLTVPKAPVEVSASLSVPVTLPTNDTTVTRTIAGQKINVTVYWYPMSVELSGSTLIVPPATNASITLQYQPSACCVGPIYSAGGGVAETPSGSVAGQTSAANPNVQQSTTTSQSLASRISPFTLSATASDPGTITTASPSVHQTTTVTQRSASVSAGGSLLWGGIAVTAVAAVAVLVALVTVRGRR